MTAPLVLENSIVNRFYILLMFEYIICICFRYILKLHTLSVDKCHVMYTCINDPSISKWNTYLLVKCLFCTVDIYRNLIPYASGWRFCMNCTDFGFGQFLKLSGNLGLIKKAISYVQVSIQSLQILNNFFLYTNKHNYYIDGLVHKCVKCKVLQKCVKCILKLFKHRLLK